MEKSELRKQIRRMEKEMREDEREASDHALIQKLLQIEAFRCAESVLLFYSFGCEPNTIPLIEYCLTEKRSVMLPRMTEGQHMEARKIREMSSVIPGRMGIMEPNMDCPVVSKEEIELILVPAMCYDETGRRLGRGAGYYDRFLDGYNGKTIGMCRDRFLCKRVPVEAHDLPVDIVVTETKILSSWK